MKALLVASVAAFGLASVGIAHAAGTDCSKQLAAGGGLYPGARSQLAASGLPEPNTAAKSQQLAASGLPEPNTAARSRQLAASGLPEPNTAAKSQLAASGMPEPNTSATTQLAAAGAPMLYSVDPNCYGN